MFGLTSEAKSDRLLRAAYRCLDHGRAERALDLATRLETLRSSGSAEVRARAQWMLGNRDEAIRTLVVGTQRWPQVAILWSYLGEYLSESGAYEAALDAFEHARHGLGGSPDWSDYNCALVLWRSKRPEEALERLSGLLARPESRADPWPQGTQGTFAKSLIFRRSRRPRTGRRRQKREQSGPSPAICQWLEACALMDLGRAHEAMEAMEFVIGDHEKEVSANTMASLLKAYCRALRLVGRDAEATDLEEQFRALFKGTPTDTN